MVSKTISLEVPVFGSIETISSFSPDNETPSSSSVKSALQATTTIECNAAGSYPVGGLTPSPAECISTYKSLLSTSSSSSSLPSSAEPSIKIMIRPRGAPTASRDCGGGGQDSSQDFIYTPEEVERMEEDIMRHLVECYFLATNANNKTEEETGAGGGGGGGGKHSFIFGALATGQPSSTSATATTGKQVSLRVDKPTCRRLVEAAAGVPCYFHRAIDDVISQSESQPSASLNNTAHSSHPGPPSYFQLALSDLADCGFRGVLTSGGRGNAVDNKERLWEMAKYVADRLPGFELVVGGGVRSRTVGPLLDGWPDEVEDGRVLLHSACLMRDGRFDGREVGRILGLGKGKQGSV